MTLSGPTLAFLGALAVVTFWGNPTGNPKKRRKPKAKPDQSEAVAA